MTTTKHKMSLLFSGTAGRLSTSSVPLCFCSCGAIVLVTVWSHTLHLVCFCVNREISSELSGSMWLWVFSTAEHAQKSALLLTCPLRGFLNAKWCCMDQRFISTLADLISVLMRLNLLLLCVSKIHISVLDKSLQAGSQAGALRLALLTTLKVNNMSLRNQKSPIISEMQIYLD